MTESTVPSYGSPRRQELGEELINAISHGIGALLAIAGTVLLIVKAVSYGSVLHVVTVTLFGVSMILLYVISCLYHALTVPRGKHVFQILDHCSIFLMILGTYLPITLIAIGGGLGWTLFGIIAVCAVVGVVLNSISLSKWKKLSMALYVMMGWLVAITLPMLYRAFTLPGFLFLLLGGAAYTIGILFYRQKEKRYRHSVWHFFVLAGTVLQFFTVYTNCCG